MLFKKGEISKAITSGTILVSGVVFLVTVAQESANTIYPADGLSSSVNLMV
ncbi:hypothetical protein DFP97_13412 [Paenibacillus prosopidis]|uniref:Uncharacterized protein n=2 Tax=Paenibacillus prosopidis TaxID=630520 RepID=A0A368VGW2_9BACL|nr:hypothetical protein DFP97_13412 [Paenibacillus prosopidis]